MFRLTGWAFALIICVGCGGSKISPVSGVVKLGGEPKSKLLVTFSPSSGGQGGIGQTNEKGEYVIRNNGIAGLAPAEYKVSITTIHEATEAPKEAANAPSGSAAYMNQGKIVPAEFKLPKELVPARYNKSTELIRNVEVGKNTFDFDLDTK